MKKLLMLVVLFVSTAGYACSCVYSEFGVKDYQRADYILDGKILKITFDEQTREKVITFKVGNAIKGKTNKIVEIRTAQDSAACGLNVEEKDNWLFFVHVYNGRWNVGLCGKNVRHSKRKGESKELKKKKCDLTKNMIKQMKEFQKPTYNEQ